MDIKNARRETRGMVTRVVKSTVWEVCVFDTLTRSEQLRHIAASTEKELRKKLAMTDVLIELKGSRNATVLFGCAPDDFYQLCKEHGKVIQIESDPNNDSESEVL